MHNGLSNFKCLMTKHIMFGDVAVLRRNQRYMKEGSTLGDQRTGLRSVLIVVCVFYPAYQGLYVSAGTPPTQPVPMPVMPQQPADVMLRQDMTVTPGEDKN